MDEYPGRRTGSSGLLVSRKSSNIVMRDSNDNKDRNPRICSRMGCSSKLNSMKGPQIGSLEKAKSSRLSFRSCASGKEIMGSSSRQSKNVNTPKETSSESRKKLSSHLETTDPQTSSILDESDTAEPIGKSRTHDHPKPTSATASSSSISQSRHGKKHTPRFLLGNQDNNTMLGSSISKHTSQGAKTGASSSRYNLRSFRCDSISDVVQSGCSSSEPSLGRKRDMGRKRSSELESSLSAKGKKTSGPSSNRGISISDSRSTVLRLGRDNDAVSVRPLRSATRTRLSEQENRSRLRLTESSTWIDASEQRPEVQLPTEASSSRADSSSRSASGSDNMESNSLTVVPFEVGITRSLMNRSGLRQYNLEGIAEVLLALDRLQQEEEPSYEQLLDLETNLLLGGLAFEDQHQDMRLDIDNMSYEELLALEERMGTVSTALTEEELQKCLESNIYRMTSSGSGTSGRKGGIDDVKCSICQEEYVDGEDVGRLGCEHRYHVSCIHKWLRLKNWCPICKASATSTSSRASPSLD
ncbi:hypothetical protein Dimus_020307 [Dionaea muscipula]